LRIPNFERAAGSFVGVPPTASVAEALGPKGPRLTIADEV
jgi:hypothetical protein